MLGRHTEAAQTAAVSVTLAGRIGHARMRIEADTAAATARLSSDIAERRDALQNLANTFPASTPPAQAYQALIAAETARLDRTDEIAAWQAAVAATRRAEEAFPLCYSLFRLAEAQTADPATGTDAATATASEGLRPADDLAAATAHDIRTLARRTRLRIEASPAHPTYPNPSQSTGSGSPTANAKYSPSSPKDTPTAR
jgi:hypothetical protein